MPDNTSSTYPMRTIPGYASSTPGIQISTYLAANAPDEELQLMQQLGIEWVMLIVGGGRENQTYDHYARYRDRLAQWGLKIYRIANHNVHNMEQVTLNLPGRDEKIDEFCEFLRNLGRVGVRYNTYGHMANGIWSSGQAAMRGGLIGRTLDLRDGVGHWNGKRYEGPLTHGREYTVDEIWENYGYFIERVAPVAEEAGVYIGIHPDDPPVPVLGGVPRPIFSTYDGFLRALEMADSPNIGVCLCVGCWLEGGTEWMGADVIEAIRTFGGMNKLFKVHFRNVSNPLPAPWSETLLDDGYMDMHRVMQALREVGFDGCAIPDHIPQMVGGHASGLAFSIGYMRAMVQAVNNEFGGA